MSFLKQVKNRGDGWVKLVARLLATAALWGQIQTSLKIQFNSIQQTFYLIFFTGYNKVKTGIVAYPWTFFNRPLSHLV
jgi:hypothetical protein